MKPYEHAMVSVKRWGGVPTDYQKIHDWFDQTKAHVPDMRHRAILHASSVSSGVPNLWTTRAPHGLWVCHSIPACERRQQQNGYDPIRVKGKR